MNDSDQTTTKSWAAWDIVMTVSGFAVLIPVLLFVLGFAADWASDVLFDNFGVFSVMFLVGIGMYYVGLINRGR